MDDMRYMCVKIGEQEKVIDIKPTKFGEKPLLFSESDGDWIPYAGPLACARFLTHEELGSLDRCLKENTRVRQEQFVESQNKDWTGRIRE